MTSASWKSRASSVTIRAAAARASCGSVLMGTLNRPQSIPPSLVRMLWRQPSGVASSTIPFGTPQAGRLFFSLFRLTMRPSNIACVVTKRLGGGLDVEAQAMERVVCTFSCQRAHRVGRMGPVTQILDYLKRNPEVGTILVPFLAIIGTLFGNYISARRMRPHHRVRGVGPNVYWRFAVHEWMAPGQSSSSVPGLY